MGKDSMQQAYPLMSGPDADEQVVHQQNIAVEGDEFTVALAPDGLLYMSLPAICSALGVNARAQIRRIQRTEELQPGLRQLVLETRGGRQRINCLQITLISAWLENLQAETVLGKVQQKLAVFQQELAAAARAAFPDLPERALVPTTPVLYDDAGAGIILEEHQPERRALIANIPAHDPSSHLVVTSFPEDTAFRESAFAKGGRWTMDVGAPHYTASNQIQVYLGHPSHLLDLSEALKRIGELGESTVLTARIAIGLWTTRRLDRRLSENGSAAIGLEEILEWRGIQKHTRQAYPGSSARISDGYETKHKRQVYLDFFLLQQCHLRRQMTLADKRGAARTLLVEGPYLRVSVVMERTLWNEQEVVGFLISPGDWFTAYPSPAFDYFALIDRRIFTMHAWQDQLAIRIGLYLVERWRQQAGLGNFHEPIAMIDLLRASMIEIDEVNLTSRFAGRIEAALFKLFEKEILGDAPRCLSVIDKTRNWGRAWLDSLWRLVPQLDVQEYYQKPDQMRRVVEGGRAARKRLK
jgi:P22_AR N-terminal domain